MVKSLFLVLHLSENKNRTTFTNQKLIVLPHFLKYFNFFCNEVLISFFVGFLSFFLSPKDGAIDKYHLASLDTDLNPKWLEVVILLCLMMDIEQFVHVLLCILTNFCMLHSPHTGQNCFIPFERSEYGGSKYVCLEKCFVH